MIKLHILLTITICLAYSAYLPSPPSQQDCLNYYSIQSTPGQCQNYNCNFPSGIFSLVVNSSNEDNLQFSLCLYLPQYNMTISYNQTDVFNSIGSIYIQGSRIEIGSALMGYSITSDNQIVIQANTSLSLISTHIKAPSIWFLTMVNINIQNSYIIYQQSLESSCKCFVEESTCANDSWVDIFPKIYSLKTDTFNMELFNVSYSNFQINSVIIASYQNVNIINSNIENSIIGIYTKQLTTSNSSFQTSELGYASDSGLGCGYFDQLLNNLLGCTGSGGSHGGSGGNSSPNNCNLVMSRTPYGSSKFPITPGSGGGFFFWQSKQASSGGGVINIQVFQFLSPQATTLKANGGIGIQDGGGGSGGSISLDYSIISGQLSIQANGGNGKSSGGGGRVRYWNHYWQNSSETNSISLSLTVKPGQQCKDLACGSNGSIYISPCPRGYQINQIKYICQLCPKGTFKQKYGYADCVDCDSQIPNSQYIQSNSIGYYQTCNISCEPGYTMVDNQCLDSFYFAISHIGGLNVLISISIIVVVVVLYLLIIMIRKLTEKDVFWSQGMSSYEAAKYFHIEQIPYHVMRVYLSGTNTQFDPWNITKHCQEKLFQKLGQNYARIIPILRTIFVQINKISKYSKFQIFLLMVLKIYYYPLSKVLSESFKSKKCSKIFKKVARINLRIPQFEHIGIKFAVKPHQSVGSIEILDYSKSVYDFYIENYFPMVFLLEQYPLGDYIIDFSDPFIKAFINELSQKEQKTKTLANQLLKQKKNTMAILNHLWSIGEYQTRLQAYLWQPPNRILGVDKQFLIDPKAQLFLIFNNQKRNESQHFSHNQNIPDIHFGEVQTLKHRMDYLRKQAIVTERKYPFWEIKNHFSQKLLVWAIGIVSILLLLASVLSFFMVIFILTQPKIEFYYGIVIYFFLFPFIDFILIFINLRMILTKSQRMLLYGIFFSIGIVAKFLLLSMCGIIELFSVVEQQITLIEIIECSWVAEFFLGVISLYLSMLINPHISKSNRKD